MMDMYSVEDLVMPYVTLLHMWVGILMNLMVIMGGYSMGLDNLEGRMLPEFYMVKNYVSIAWFKRER